MTTKTAELLIRRALEKQCDITFAFQGGEPTLWGLENFQFFVKTVNKLNMDGVNISYGLQTNGLVINDEWAKFFYENKFLIGLSIDGLKDTHDANRIDNQGEKTFLRVIGTARLFKKYNVDFNVLTVVRDQNARDAVKIYRYFKAQGFRHLQFIPCIDNFGVEQFGLTPERYEKFLTALFEAWHKDYIARDYVSVRHIDNLIGILQGRPPESCAYSGKCGVYFVIESDGGLYPCDFYCTDRWRLGSIENENCFELTNKHKEFLAMSAVPLPECETCELYNMCRGGCRRDREPNLIANKYCSSYKAYYPTVKKLLKLSNMMK